MRIAWLTLASALLFTATIRGFRWWAAALVLDPNAPSGISHVVGPTLLRIRR